MITIKYIADRWEKTIRAVRPPNPARTPDLLAELLRCYSEKGRHYHNLDHLRYAFTVMDEVVAKLPGMGSVELALWYHDICYDTRARDNEERSGDLAQDRLLSLGFDRGYVNQIVALILATKHEADPRTREARVLLDVDLSILGADPAEYDVYEQSIRREYAWVPEEQFRAGRTAILKRFLQRRWIFATPEFRGGPFEGLAFANLSRALNALETP